MSTELQIAQPNKTKEYPPRLLWLIVCEQLIVDKKTNKVSFINVSEHLKSKILPFAVDGMVLATSWAAQQLDDTVDLRMVVTAPDGEEVLTFAPPTIAFTHKYERVTIDLTGLTLKQEGPHSFAVEVSVDGVWQAQGSLEIFVTQVK